MVIKPVSYFAVFVTQTLGLSVFTCLIKILSYREGIVNHFFSKLSLKSILLYFTLFLENVEKVINEWLETAQELGREIPQPKGRLMYA